MTGPSAASLGELLRGLFQADDRDGALRVWLAAVEPEADVVVLGDGASNAPLIAMRRSTAGWSPVALPPLEMPDPAGRPLRRSISERREDEFDDLLASLGMSGVLAVTLETPHRDTLLLARARTPFDDEDERVLVDRAGWLTSPLAAQQRAARRSRRDGHAARELAALLDLSRELASPVGPRAAALSAARALQQVLDAAAGGVAVAVSPDEDGFVAVWPEGTLGREIGKRLAALAAQGRPCQLVPAGVNALPARERRDLRWVRSTSSEAGDSYPRARVVVGFDGEIPAAAARVAEAVETLLRLALDRLFAERHREQRRLSATVEALPLGVALMSRGGRVRFVNAAGRDLLDDLGAWPGDGRAIEKLGSVDLGGIARQAIREGGAGAEILFPSRDRIVELRVVPTGGDPERGDGASRDVLLVFEDVTEQRKRARQLAQAEKLSALGVLISGIVHEINNPLSTILGYSQMLGERRDEQKADRWIRLIEQEAQRCQRIVSNMLALARQREPRHDRVSLETIAERALSLLAYPLRVAGIEVTLRAARETPQIEGDADALLQVLINLLTNAIHALEEHDGERRILVRIDRSEEGSARVVVEDNGPGVAPEARAKLFDPFFTTKPEGKGTGLGLSLVASTVARHGGEIDLASAEGRGARFTIVLPAGAGRSKAGAEAAPPRRQIAGLEGCRVLVADDEPAVAGLLREVLERAGARVELAADGCAALERILADPPDVVIADRRMPGLGGERLAEELASRRPELAGRVVLSTGEPQSVGDGPIVEVAGRPCLIKPFELPALIALVRDVASGSRRHEPASPPTFRPSAGEGA